jgi:hypothetical protein
MAAPTTKHALNARVGSVFLLFLRPGCLFLHRRRSTVHLVTCVDEPAECNTTLSAGKCAMINGVPYCKPHFKQLFAEKGSYDFGKTHLYMVWQDQLL